MKTRTIRSALLMAAIAASLGPINARAQTSGSTYADPVLQRDALRFAFIGFGTRVKNCSSARVVATRPMLSGPRHSGQPWREVWTVKGCSRTIDVPLDFVPDATGTTITVPSRDMVER